MREFLDQIHGRLSDVVREMLDGGDSGEAPGTGSGTGCARDDLDGVIGAFTVSVAKSGFGDASANIAFLLARVMQKSPGEIAALVSERYNDGLPGDGLVARSVPHKSGYVNFEARWGLLAGLVLADSRLGTYGGSDMGRGEAVTVEHTSVNPNKALHIGHVRNVVIGDAVSRVLAKSGYAVNVLNYVDDSGLQVADVIVGFRHLGFAPDPPPGKSFAQYCGDDVYVRTAERCGSDPKLEALRRDVLREIEDGSTETAALAVNITRRVLADQLRTCWRLSVSYDCLNFESHVIQSGLWTATFETLKRMGLVELDCSGGQNDGCWVIRDAHAAGDSGGATEGGGPDACDDNNNNSSSNSSSGGDADAHGPPGGENRDKVVVRSNGTATYIAKDIPYAAWKLGLVDDPFGYAEYENRQPGKRVLWQTTYLAGDDPRPPDGHDLTHAAGAHVTPPPKSFAGKRVITVIDSRQSALQRIIAGLMRRFRSDESAYVHLAYESVTLSPDTAAALGLETGGRQAQMSGRRGLYVDADSVYEMIYKKAESETRGRHPEMPDDDVERISRAISVGTIRYEMIRQDLDKIIMFDLGRSMSLEGDTASYVQYAGARASRILEKAGRPPPDAVSFDLLSSRSELDLIRLIGTFEMSVSDAARNLSPKVVARHCHDLAVGFNAFYEHCRVLDLGDKDLEDARLFLVASFRHAISSALGVVGIDAPDVM